MKKNINVLIYPRNKNLVLRLNLCYNLSLIFPFEAIFNNNNKLLTDFLDIENIINNNKKNITRFFYINKEIIHQILYDSENVIRLYDKHVKCLGDYFYIDLLIKYNCDIIDYSYSLDFIKNLNIHLKKDNLSLKNIIISKISLSLIYNYKGTDEYDEDKDLEELNLIEKNNIDIILNNVNHLKDLNINHNVDEILLMNVDDIYIELIISLIQSNKFTDFEYIYNILNKLDLQSIYLNNKMFSKLQEKLDISLDYINRYKISDIHDLFNIEKINFYYFLIKYILKNSFFIYQIPLLLYTRKKIIKIIKNNLYQLCFLKAKQDNNNINVRIDYIINMITDSKYYYNKYKKSDKIILLKDVLAYYKNYLFESKKEDINIIEEIINNEKNVEFFNYLHDYENAVKLNNRLKIINYLFNNENIKMTEKKICKHANDWETIEQLIKKKCYKKLTKNIKRKLVKYFSNKENESIILNIFKEDEYKTFINENIKFLNNNTDENKLIDKEEIEKIDKSENNSNIKSTSSSVINVKAIESINEISKKNDTSIIVESYIIQSQNINMEKIRINNKIESEKDQDFSFNNMSFIKEVESDKFEIIKKSSLYKILEYSKTLINYKNPKIIKKLTNDYFIIGGEEKYILLYNYLYILINKIRIGQYTYCIEEIYSNVKEIKIIIGSLNYIYIIEIDLEINDTKITKYLNEIFPVENIIVLEEDNYIMSGIKGTYIMSNIFDTLKKGIRTKLLEGVSYKNVISINKKIIALSSNQIYPNGDDILVFYNLTTKSIIKTIKGFSFISSINGLSLINNLNSNGKILLCACKKYNSRKKNGILLVYIEFNQDKEKFYAYFFDTNDFEVYCFCQISNVNNNNPINGDISKKENIIINNTDYFLVGGFDENENGKIKLFKMINKDNPNEIKINYIQDIIIKPNDKFEGFQGAINCMIQSDMFGNIIIGDMNGNIYLMKSPNISFYLKSPT